VALVSTTLASAKALNDRTIKLTSATGIANKMLVRVDGELMRVTDVSLSPTIGVVPGYNGSAATPHGILAPAVFGLASDFVGIMGINPQTEVVSQSIGLDGALTGPNGVGTVPVTDTLFFITKATAATLTIAAPAVDQQNTITIISTTAAAHVLTLTGNTATMDVATFIAGIGSALVIKAQSGAWAVIGGNAVVA
jgi:hypothetical protein